MIVMSYESLNVNFVNWNLASQYGVPYRQKSHKYKSVEPDAPAIRYAY